MEIKHKKEDEIKAYTERCKLRKSNYLEGLKRELGTNIEFYHC